MSGLTIFIMVLVAACFTGLAYSAISAFSTAAQSYNSTYSKETSRSLEDMFLFIPPRRIAEISWLSAIVVFLLMFIMTGGVSGSLLQVMVRMLICLIIGGGVLFLPRYVIMWLKVRRRNRFNIQLVEALSGMSNAMKSGFSIMQAMEHIVANGESPISEEFETMLHQTRVGVGFQEALRNMDRRAGSEE